MPLLVVMGTGQYKSILTTRKQPNHENFDLDLTRYHLIEIVRNISPGKQPNHENFDLDLTRYHLVEIVRNISPGWCHCYSYGQYRFILTTRRWPKPGNFNLDMTRCHLIEVMRNRSPRRCHWPIVIGSIDLIWPQENGQTLEILTWLWFMPSSWNSPEEKS